MDRHKRRKTLLIIIGIGSFVALCFLCSIVASLSGGRATPTPAAPTQVVRVTGEPSATQVSPSTATETPTFTAAVPYPTPATPTATKTPTPKPDPRVAAQVIEVVDGDTIRVSIDGRAHTVRYIGIDTPETVHPTRPVEWMGQEASAANSQLVAGRRVLLEKDVSDTDRHGRLLRYVWVGQVMVNAELVRLGYAQASAYPPDVKYQDLFLQLQAEARGARRGLWGTPPTATPAPIRQPTAPPRNGCDPAYPDVCIPPPPPDLDCGDIPYRRFRVLPPDPHRFDGGNDGIGCEN